MSFVSPIVATGDQPLIIGRDDGRALRIALAILCLAAFARLSGTVDSDVAWQLWIAQRMQAGANLYRDIIETNPPLWFWMARPIERASGLLQVRIEAVLIVTVAAAVALSLCATSRLIPAVSERQRTLLLSYAAMALFAMPWMHVGQREQIVLIGALPYAALIAARRDRRAVPMLLAAGIGVGAALGFALKHYFLIAPMLLELWLLASLGRKWRPFRPETIAVGVTGALYVAAVFLERDYLEIIVPLVGQAYGVFSAPSLDYLFGPFALVALTTIAMVALHLRQLRRSSFASALLIAAVGFGAAYFVQYKGWTYHSIPMLGCGSIALASLIASADEKARVLRIGGPVLLALPFTLSASEAAHPSLPSRDLLQAVSGLPAGTPVGFISEDTALAWSVTLQHRFAYPSRYNGFWMLKAVANNQREARPDPRVQELGPRVIAETIADFRCMPPRRIIAVRGGPLPYFARDPRFAALLSHYRLISRTSLDVFELTSPLQRLPSTACVRGH